VHENPVADFTTETMPPRCGNADLGAHRRIEITLERESVSVLLPDRQQNAQATQQAAHEARIPKTLKEKAK